MKIFLFIPFEPVHFWTDQIQRSFTKNILIVSSLGLVSVERVGAIHRKKPI